MNGGIAVWWRTRRDSPALDAVVAVVLAAVLVAGAYGEAHPNQISDKIPAGTAAAHTPAAAFALVAVAALVLAGRYRWPVTVLALCTAAVIAYTLLGYVNGSALVAPPIALYAVAIKATPRRAIGCAVVTTAVLMAAGAARNPFGTTAGGFYIIPAMTAIACFGGIAVANRRAYVASIEARAQDAARRRIDEERLRIARELHDVVAHTMATINVQAGAAVHVAADRPQAAVDALQVIRAVSKNGLRELRSILNVLRQGDEPDGPFPAPGLDQADALIASARSAGLQVTVSVSGEPRPLPAETDLAAYRIVQESLTNVIRHAGPAAVVVTLGYTGSELRIEVTDTGLGSPAAAADGGGHGLAGMRERAVSAGGSLEAGPAPGGGFRVAARLPLGRQQHHDDADQPAGASRS
ncbi:MAG TPA: sensor histidine kinase [Streptosporangiaceae bacterium]